MLAFSLAWDQQFTSSSLVWAQHYEKPSRLSPHFNSSVCSKKSLTAGLATRRVTTPQSPLPPSLRSFWPGAIVFLFFWGPPAAFYANSKVRYNTAFIYVSREFLYTRSWGGGIWVECTPWFRDHRNSHILRRFRNWEILGRRRHYLYSQSDGFQESCQEKFTPGFKNVLLQSAVSWGENRKTDICYYSLTKVWGQTEKKNNCKFFAQKTNNPVRRVISEHRCMFLCKAP